MPSRGVKFLQEKFPRLNYGDFFHWSNRNQFDLQKAIEIEQITKLRYSFFRKFREIAAKLSTDWDHVDLFFVRKTSQKEFHGAVFADKKGTKLNEFGQKQRDFTKRLIKHASPRMVLVANAAASRQFRKMFRLRWDDEHGHHYASIAGKSVPVFLSSMLTQQRALDVFSYERLLWQMRKAWVGLHR